jgi:hypothetical protein
MKVTVGLIWITAGIVSWGFVLFLLWVILSLFA